MYTFGSLFAGIGGIDLGFERAGLKCKWQVEIDDYATKVLEKHWPNVSRWRDVKTFPPEDNQDWNVDVIAGGFPCQDISVAGKGAGLNGERSGLFFEIIRLARQLRPRAIVLENVSALLVRGMGDVLAELAKIGYDAEWHCIPASAVGAPHRRDRVFIIAYTQHDGSHGNRENEQERQCEKVGRSQFTRWDGCDRNVADSIRSGAGHQNKSPSRQKRKTTNASESETLRQGNRQALSERTDAGSADCSKRNTRKQKSLANSDNEQRKGSEQKTIRGKSTLSRKLGRSCEDIGKQWSVEPDVGRVADGVPARVDRLRGLGNAVVPQVAQVVATILLERLEREQ